MEGLANHMQDTQHLYGLEMPLANYMLHPSIYNI